MKVLVEAVENGFILRELGDNEFPRVLVFSIDETYDEAESQRKESQAVVDMAFALTEMLGRTTSKHRYFNFRFSVLDNKGEEVDYE